MQGYRGEGKRRSCSVACLIVLIVGTAAVLYFWLIAGRVPGRTVLEADFEKGVIEYVPDDPVARVMMTKKPALRDVIEALEQAANDDRVLGLVARVGEGPLKIAQIQEIRDALIAFRKKGKFTVAWAETFGEAGAGNRSYYLATAFDEVHMQPSGDVGLTGLMIEQRFLRGTLDKLGIVPRLDHRKEYKTYMNMVTERKFTPAHREASKAVLDSLFGQMVKGIAEGRKLAPDHVRALIDRGPFLGQEAVDAKLVDRLAYRDEVYERVKEKAGKKAKFLQLAEYFKRAGSPYTKGTTVALIHGVGGVERGPSSYNPATGELVMGSDTVADAFRKAAEDKSVKAILFRIDSPGGSYVASDTIWREAAKARKAGKPVVVSMGSVAGSGGYFVALPADKIVAQPATITGSIGVIGGKVVLTGFWNKLGVTWDEVHTSKNADAWSLNKDLTREQWQRFQDWLDRVYDDFTAKVAEGRKLPKERVLQIAKGRIWTGEDAKALGLVDELGGMTTALGLVRSTLKLPEDARLRLKVYPERKSLIAALFGNSSTREEGSAAVLADMVERMQPSIRAAASLAPGAREDVLSMPVLVEE